MYTSVRPYTAGLAAASAGILTLSLVTAPPDMGIAVPRAEVHAARLAAVTAADISTAVVKIPLKFASVTNPPNVPISAATPSTTSSVVRPAAASQTAAANTAATNSSTTTSSSSAAASTDQPDLISFANSLLEYIKSLGFGDGAVILAIGLSGVAATLFGAAYAWNGFVDFVNPVLRFFGQPQLKPVPICFFCESTAAAPARLAAPAATAANSADSPVRPATRAGLATTKRVARATEHPTAPVGRQDESASPTAASVREVNATPTVAATADTTTRNTTRSVAGAGTNKPNTGRSTDKAGTGKKATAHSARSVGGSKRK